MPERQTHPAAQEQNKLLAECNTQRTRRTGPGGQHRNKVETAIVITHTPSGTIGEAGERRSQHENHRVALFRLRVNLALRIRCPVNLDLEPSPLWQKRCRGGKIAINPTHADFPVLLAELLDVFQGCDGNMQAVADFFCCTRSQLTRLLKKEPRAFVQVNQKRAQQNLAPLR